METHGEIGTREFLEGLVEALSDRHGQLDVKLKDVTLSLGDSPLALKLSGAITVSVHLRELTDHEKDAHVAANLARIQT